MKGPRSEVGGQKEPKKPEPDGTSADPRHTRPEKQTPSLDSSIQTWGVLPPPKFTPGLHRPFG